VDDQPVRVTGRIKWFDAKRGFGFLVSEALDCDVMVHKTLLRGHDRRTLPEGAVLEVEAQRRDRGMQAIRVLSIDLRFSLPDRPRAAKSTDLAGPPGAFERATVRWFNRERAYGFLERQDGADVFIHAEVLRRGHIMGLDDGEPVEARIATGPKGLVAVELRR
jgi:CspA family cold shock protein